MQTIVSSDRLPRLPVGIELTLTERRTMATKYKYYVNDKEQDNGDNEVHKEGCTYMPNAGNRTYLGEFEKCEGAVTEAKKTYPDTANGCATCSSDCHTG